MLTQEEQIAQAGLQYTTPTASTATPDFTKVLQDRLLQSSDMISSANTGLESQLQRAINFTADSTSKGSQAIASNYDRQIRYTNEAQQNQITAARERGVGVNTSDVAYKAMASEADKNLKDLEQRKNELMLQNDAAGASKISDLIVKTLEMKNTAMQQTFSNLLSMGNLSIQASQEQRAAKAQTFAEKSAIASIGLQYGIPVTDGMSLQDVVTKAAPMASATQKATLAKLVAETNKANAEANKAYADGHLPNLSDPLLLGASADLYRSNYADFVTKAKTVNEVATVKQAAVKAEGQDVQTIVANAVKGGTTDPNELFNLVQGQLKGMNKPMIAPKESMAIIESATKNIPPKPQPKSLVQKLKDTAQSGIPGLPEGGLIGQYFK